jgi:hypothetical protein
MPALDFNPAFGILHPYFGVEVGRVYVTSQILFSNP